MGATYIENGGRLRVYDGSVEAHENPSTDEQPGSLFHTNPEVQHSLREKE